MSLMSPILPRLRGDLDFHRSPLPDRPGLLLRDPLRYSDAAIVVPPILDRCLTCFDGAHSSIDLHGMLAGLTGRGDLGFVADELVRGLSEAGFLDDDIFRALRDGRHDAFARADVRPAAFAGGGYPAERSALADTIASWIGRTGNASGSSEAPERGELVAIAAPHVSPAGGTETYGAAYRALDPQLGDRTFVILGTSHYGQPNRLGLTRKSFHTPLGQATTDTGLVDELARKAPAGMLVEDYCHAVEHSIEFQVLFLQSVFGASVRILPVLCGPFVCEPSLRSGRSGTARSRPEDDPELARALGALGELQARQGPRLFWVLGVDMAHMGQRYGDTLGVQARDGFMTDVAVRDHSRLDRIAQGDAKGFWDLVHERGADDLKWCGSSPLYSFLRACPGSRGRILHYDQWNIDEASVVTFAALAFRR
jgi:predicted class III extradiol MEMO1 family dioxygenase